MITIKVKKIKSLGEKIKGLMFGDNINPIYFETRFGIHTMFMKAPIDVIVLNGKYVSKIKNTCVHGASFFGTQSISE